MAAINPRDAHHEAARRVFYRIADREWGEVLTSDFILAEALDFVRVKIRRAEAIDALLDPVFGRDDAPPAVTDVLRVHAGRFAEALKEFRARHDHGLSFTDWTTVVTMRDAGATEVATFDRGFDAFVGVVNGAP